MERVGMSLHRIEKYINDGCNIFKLLSVKCAENLDS